MAHLFQNRCAMRILSMLLCLVLLQACSGSGGAGLVDERTPEEVERDLEEQPISPPGELPTSGAAEYDGFMFADLPVTPTDPGLTTSYVGTLAMTVSFDGSGPPLSGRAVNFTDRLNVTLGGALDVDGGAIFRGNDPDSNYTLEGDVAGTLRHPDVGNLAVDATLSGEFRGINQLGVQGVLFGDVRSAAGIEIFDGSFAAERQVDD